MGIQAIAGDPVDVAHARSQRQAVQRTTFHIVAQPGAGLITRGVHRTLTLFLRTALLVANVGIGVCRLQAEALRQLADRLQLDPFRFNFAN
ncbi:hypothetical protein D3C81_1590550 [compost metagenome]